MRKIILTTHITFSVGWLGAVVVFLALAITGLNTPDVQLACSMYLAMNVTAWSVILPLCLASLLTGILQGLVSKWGLFKYYWVVVKLTLTVVATILLLLHMQAITELSRIATNSLFALTETSEQRIQLVADAGAAIVLLLLIMTISVYKPWGKVRLSGAVDRKGLSFQAGEATAKRSVGYYVLIGSVILIVLFIAKHLLGGGLANH